MLRLVIAAAAVVLLAMPVYADQAAPNADAQHSHNKVETVKAIHKLTREICDIYPNAPCVLDQRADDDDR